MLFALPLLFTGNAKNSCKTSVFAVKNCAISYVTRSSSAPAFISYWENTFRNDETPVCDIPYDDYKKMYEQYSELSKEDREIVNATSDKREPEYTIGKIIQTLVNKFYPNTKKVMAEKQKLDQSTIIIIATVVALVGATAISVLYLLKNNKVIK